MPRPCTLATPSTIRPLPFEEALRLLCLRHGLTYLSSHKPHQKNEMEISFQKEENSAYGIAVRIEPVWKTEDEHDDMFYDAAEKELVRWLGLHRIQGFRRMALEMAKMIPRELFTVQLAEGKYERADGMCFCSVCRQPYVDHPEIEGMPTFHVICDRKIVKT